MKALFLFFLLTISGLAHSEQRSNNPDVLVQINRLIETRACAGCELQNSDLSGIDLSGVDLSAANLNGSKLHQTNLRGANLRGASLRNISLSDTALAGADLRNADLSDIDIDQVFEYVEIIGTQFEGARFKHGVICGPAPTKGGWGCQQL